MSQRPRRHFENMTVSLPTKFVAEYIQEGAKPRHEANSQELKISFECRGQVVHIVKGYISAVRPSFGDLSLCELSIEQFDEDELEELGE